MPAPQRFTLPTEHPTARLDKVLVELLGLSRARAKALLETGGVRVNGHKLKKGANVKGGDAIEVDEALAASTDKRGPPKAQPELDLRVVLEDPAFVILDKPAPMPSHPLDADELGTVANFLAARFPECIAANPAEPREAGLLHRLDVETSGLLAAARTPEAYAKLREAFGARQVEKIYLALTSGPLADSGTIELPLAHSTKDKRLMASVGSAESAVTLKARDAITHFKVLERKGDYSLIQVRIETGVMHQIRVHFASIGAPICGDALYGGPPVAGLDHQFLHAAKLGFAHPTTGAPVVAESPLPAMLDAVWKGLPA